MAQKKGAAKKQKTAQQVAELKSLEDRPTRHYCDSPKCPSPKDAIVKKDLQPAGPPRGPMKFYHKTCYKSL